MNRTKLRLSLERLEDRRMLAVGPAVWLGLNNGGVAGGLPADFVEMFEHPDSWSQTARGIDTI